MLNPLSCILRRFLLMPLQFIFESVAKTTKRADLIAKSFILIFFFYVFLCTLFFSLVNIQITVS